MTLLDDNGVVADDKEEDTVTHCKAKDANRKRTYGLTRAGDDNQGFPIFVRSRAGRKNA